MRAGSVLFLCHGNVCRSPFAEHLFARESRLRLGGAFSARSAGFIGPNRGSPSEALAGSLRFGIDLSEHRSQLVTPDMVRRSALVVVMSSTQASAILRRSRSDAPPVLVLGDLDPLPIAKRTILDPWGGGPSVFDESYTRIARCVDALVTALRDR